MADDVGVVVVAVVDCEEVTVVVAVLVAVDVPVDVKLVVVCVEVGVDVGVESSHLAKGPSESMSSIIAFSASATSRHSSCSTLIVFATPNLNVCPIDAREYSSTTICNRSFAVPSAFLSAKTSRFSGQNIGLATLESPISLLYAHTASKLFTIPAIPPHVVPDGA